MTCCPVCAESARSLQHRVRGYEIWRCHRCGAWYLDDAAIAGAAADDAAYAGSYLHRGGGDDGPARVSGYYDYEAERTLHLRNFGQNLGILAEFAGNAGSLCDVGCASGHFLAAALASGRYSGVTGVDVAAEAVAAVTAELGCPAHAGRVETMVPPGKFDVVTMWETIEHIPTPVAALTALREWLAPDGLLAIGTGDNTAPLARLLGRRWWYLIPPDHCIYYNPSALTHVLMRTGYRVVGVRRVWHHWVSAANVVMKLLRSAEVEPATAMAVARRAGAWPVPVVHGTTIVVLARKA